MHCHVLPGATEKVSGTLQKIETSQKKRAHTHSHANERNDDQVCMRKKYVSSFLLLPYPVTNSLPDTHTHTCCPADRNTNFHRSSVSHPFLSLSPLSHLLSDTLTFSPALHFRKIQTGVWGRLANKSAEGTDKQTSILEMRWRQKELTRRRLVLRLMNQSTPLPSSCDC